LLVSHKIKKKKKKGRIGKKKRKRRKKKKAALKRTKPRERGLDDFKKIIYLFERRFTLVASTSQNKEKKKGSIGKKEEKKIKKEGKKKEAAIKRIKPRERVPALCMFKKGTHLCSDISLSLLVSHKIKKRRRKGERRKKEEKTVLKKRNKQRERVLVKRIHKMDCLMLGK
jgi:hypothetical protein